MLFIFTDGRVNHHISVRNNKSTRQREYEATKVRDNESTKQQMYETTEIRNNESTKQRKCETTTGRCETTRHETAKA